MLFKIFEELKKFSSCKFKIFSHELIFLVYLFFKLSENQNSNIVLTL